MMRGIGTMPVTDTRKRYAHVFVCAACDKLAHAERAHAITCSPACRVWLHRHPERLADLKAACASLDVTPALVQEAAAINLLLPEATARIDRREVKIAELRGDLWRAYWQRVQQAVEAAP